MVGTQVQQLYIVLASGTCATQPWETTSGTGSTGHIGSVKSESDSKE